MLYWATVISFLIGIMTYMLYPQKDRIKTVHLPASEIYVSGFVNQHQAAKDYLREGLIALNNLSNVVIKSDVGTDPDEKDSVFILSGEKNDGTDLLDEFLSPVQSISTTNDLKPKEGFVSVLGCFSGPERKVNGKYVERKFQTCTTSSAETKYVFTYGPLPDELDTPYMRNKTLLWEAAILKRTHGNPDCGFLQRFEVKDENGEKIHWFVNTSSRLTRKIPSAFQKVLSDYADTIQNVMEAKKSESNRLVVQVGDQKWAPLLFCMTPANDPYPRKGLAIHYDSKINTGVAGEHSLTIPANGWMNLADASYGILSSPEGRDWHTDNCNEKCSEDADNPDCYSCRNNPSLTMNGLQINTNKKINDFGNTFTISFLASFNPNKDYPNPYYVLKTESCEASCSGSGTSETCNQCLNVKLVGTGSSGTIEIHFCLEEGGTESCVHHVIDGSKQQFDYIVGPKGHRLYVDGKCEDADCHDEKEINSELSGGNILIGDSSVSSDWNLYNFLMYKKELTEDDGASADDNGKFDVRGLARIHKSNTERYDIYSD